MQPALFSTFGSSSTKYRRLRCPQRKKLPTFNLLPFLRMKETTFPNSNCSLLLFLSPISFFLPRVSHPLSPREYDRFPWARVVIPRELLDSV